MKNFAKVLAASAIAATTLASCGGASTGSAKISNEIDSVSYLMGQLVGADMVNNYDFINKEAFAAGMRAGVKNDTSKYLLSDMQAANMYIRQFMMKKQEEQMAEAQKKAEETREAGMKFLEENAKKEGIVSLPNGLQYKIIEEGNGAQPAVTDTVVCDYKGTLIDGTVFDASENHGGPAEFPLNRVIQGWQELIPMMKLGAKWQLFITPELGYGAQDTPTIPANSVLIFEVTLHQIKKGPAAK